MRCESGISILAPGCKFSANLVFHPVAVSALVKHIQLFLCGAWEQKFKYGLHGSKLHTQYIISALPLACQFQIC